MLGVEFGRPGIDAKEQQGPWMRVRNQMDCPQDSAKPDQARLRFSSDRSKFGCDEVANGEDLVSYNSWW
jgi:hypothetical protein